MAMQGSKKHIIDGDEDVKSKKMKFNHIPQQDFINYLSVPPLESMAIVNIALAICKQSDIRDAIIKHHLKFDFSGSLSDATNLFRESLNEIYNLFKGAVDLLPIPNLLKIRVSKAIGHVAQQILAWLKYYGEDIIQEHFDFESIHWTNEGIIDNAKTLENWIDSGELIFDLFKKACELCLEDRISDLWEKLPKARKQNFLLGTWTYEKYDKHLFAYWTCVVNNRLSVLMSKIKAFDPENIYNCSHSIYKNMFTLAVVEGNICAVQYFWKKITFQEINTNLAQLFHILELRIEQLDIIKYSNPFVSVLFFLLSKLIDTKQQIEIFQKHSRVILFQLVIRFPYRRFLLPTIKVMWDFLDKEVYVELLKLIVLHIKEVTFEKLILTKLWRDSPIDFKKYFIRYLVNPSYSTNLILILLGVKDIVAVKEILLYANVEEKRKIIFRVIENRGFCSMYLDGLSLFMELVEDIFPSVSGRTIRNVKDKILVKYGNALCCQWILADNFQKLDEFLNCMFSSQDQIDYFKNAKVRRNEITHTLLREGDYGLLNRFLYWYCSSEQGINQFKKDFVTSLFNSTGYTLIFNLGMSDWSLFEKFLSWCFNSQQEINKFKEKVLKCDQPPLGHFIFSHIKYNYAFEFVDKIIRWCCDSNEVIKHFKHKLVLSNGFMSVLEQFLRNEKVLDDWILLQKFINFFSPLEEKLKAKLKLKIKREMDLSKFPISFPIQVKHLLRLLDDHEYSITDSRSSEDSSNTASDDDCDISNSRSSDDCSDDGQ